MQTLRENNSRILTIKNAKFSEYYFYMHLNIWGDFQICTSVPLSRSVTGEATRICQFITKTTLLFTCGERKFAQPSKSLKI